MAPIRDFPRDRRLRVAALLFITVWCVVFSTGGAHAAWAGSDPQAISPDSLSDAQAFDSTLTPTNQPLERKRGVVHASIAIGAGQARWDELDQNRDSWGFQWGLSLGFHVASKVAVGLDVRSLLAGSDNETESSFFGLFLAYYPWREGFYLRASGGGTGVDRKSVELSPLETVDVDESGYTGVIAIGHEWGVASRVTTAIELSAEYTPIDGDVIGDYLVLGAMIRTTAFGRWGR
jgi:hypothetical protein